MTRRPPYVSSTAAWPPIHACWVFWFRPMTALPSVWCGPSPKPERRPIEQSPRLASLGVVPALVWTQMTAVSRGAIDPGFVGLQRQLRAVAPDAYAVADAPALLEHAGFADAPRLVSATVIEGSVMRARRVLGDPEIGFAAFLDGTQSSRVLAHADGVPVIHGTVAAVIRQRRNRRLTTWARPIVEQRLYAPLAALSAEWREAIASLGAEIVDTTAAAFDPAGPLPHPFSLTDAAVHRVQHDRERAEQQLAERWCAHESTPLFIDGGISGSERVAVAECTVGVVKSHRTLYAEAQALQTILRLRRAE